MDLYLQFGFGMMQHARELIALWKGAGVILSPRDLKEEALRTVGTDIADLGGEVLLDPQCFNRDQDHHRLTDHAYWKVYKSQSTTDLVNGTGARELIRSLSELNRGVGSSRTILPGLLADPVTEEWLAFHERLVAEGADQLGAENVLATVALSEAAMASEDQIEAVVENSERWACGGIYLVCQTPGAYLVEDPAWLANLLILASGLKLAGKAVVVGYCHHQMLSLAAAKVDTIASGTWLNVRAFQPEKFYTPEEEKPSQRTIWYYCPQALSEYKLPFLDLAKRNGVFDRMRPSASMGSSFADPLFAGAQPTTVDWGEQNAFRHYLTCLRAQAGASPQNTFVEAFDAQTAELDAAEKLLKDLRKAGVLGGDRDFKDCIDVNRAALATFENARGERLRRSW